MVAVGNRNVAAAFTVLVVVVRMLVMFSALALVPVAFVLTVDVAIVEVVGVVAVWECDVAAALAVGVCVVFVDGVCHGFYSLWVVRLLRVFNLFPLKSVFISISIRRPKFFKTFSLVTRGVWARYEKTLSARYVKEVMQGRKGSMRLMKGFAAVAGATLALLGGQAVAHANPGVGVKQGQVILTAEGTACTVGYVEGSRAWTSAHCGLSGQQVYNEYGQHLGTLRWFKPSGAAEHDLAYVQFAAGTYSEGNPLSGDGINPVPRAGEQVCVTGRLSGNDCAQAIDGPKDFDGMHYATNLPKVNGDSGSGVFMPGRSGVVGIYQGGTVVSRNGKQASFTNYARMPYANELAGLPHQGFVPRRPNIAPPRNIVEVPGVELRKVGDQAEGLATTSSEGFGIDAIRGIANNYGIII